MNNGRTSLVCLLRLFRDVLRRHHAGRTLRPDQAARLDMTGNASSFLFRVGFGVLAGLN